MYRATVTVFLKSTRPSISSSMMKSTQPRVVLSRWLASICGTFPAALGSFFLYVLYLFVWYLVIRRRFDMVTQGMALVAPDFINCVQSNGRLVRALNAKVYHTRMGR